MQDDENDVDINEGDGYDFDHHLVADKIKDDEFDRKTRGSFNKPGRIIKACQ